MFTRAGIIIIKKKNNLSGNLLRAARSGWHTFLMPANPLKRPKYNITVTDDEIGSTSLDRTEKKSNYKHFDADLKC